MAAVRSKDTGPEMLVRRFLWSNGLRYRVNVSSLPGTPDITLSRDKVAIFVHGCFWHGHAGCSRGKLPKSRLDYWSAKVNANKNRDAETKERLEGSGWKHLVIWGCQLRTQKASSVTLPQLLEEIRTISAESETGPTSTLGKPMLTSQVIVRDDLTLSAVKGQFQ